MGFKSFYEQAGGAQGALEPKRMNDSVVEVFGRHNPPHLGHGMTFKHANDIAQNEGADQSKRDHVCKTVTDPFTSKLKSSDCQKGFRRNANIVIF